MASLRALKFLGAYTFLGFLPLALNFLLLPIYTAKLLPAEYGILSITGILQTFASLGMTLGLDAAFARFYFDHLTSPEDRRRLLTTVLAAVTGAAAILAGLAALAGPWFFARALPQISFARYGWLVLAAAYSQVCYSLLFSWYRNGEALRVVLGLALSTTLLSTIGTVVSVLLQPDAHSALLGRTAGFALGVLPFLAYTLRGAGRRVDFDLLKRLYAFGLPLAAYVLVFYLVTNGDRLLMQRWFSLSILGVYALAATLVQPLEIMLQAVQQAMQPSFYRRLAAQDATVDRDISRAYLLVVLGSIVAMLVLDRCAEPALLLLRGDKYRGVSYFITLLAFAQLFRIRWAAHAFPLFHAKATRPLPFVTAIALVAGIVAARATRPVLGPLGVAFGVLAWKTVHEVSTAFVARRTATLRVDVRGSTPWILATGAYVGLVYASRRYVPAIAERCALVAALVLGSAAVLAIAAELRRVVRRPTTAGPAVAAPIGSSTE